MISNTSSLCGCSFQPSVPTNQSHHPQALVLSAEVVNRPYQIHPCFKRSVVTRYSSSSSDKTRQALPKRSIDSFYEGRVDYSSTLRSFKHSFNFGLRPFNDSPINADNTPLLVLFDCLRNENSLPRLKSWAARLFARYAFTKHKPNRCNVSLQPICTEQDACTQRGSRSTYLLNKTGYQSRISAGCNNTSQPQTRAYHQSQSHPHNSALEFDSKFIHLNLAQIAWFA